jgi:hypothetical protein
VAITLKIFFSISPSVMRVKLIQYFLGVKIRAFSTHKKIAQKTPKTVCGACEHFGVHE